MLKVIEISQHQFNLAMDVHNKSIAAQKHAELVYGVLLAAEYIGQAELREISSAEGRHTITFEVPDIAPKTPEGEPESKNPKTAPVLSK